MEPITIPIPESTPPASLHRIDIRDIFFGLKCGVCGRAKRKHMAHCQFCFWELPPESRKALYRHFGKGFEEAYRESVAILRRGPAAKEERVSTAAA